MTEVTEGIILRTRALTESSLIVCWITRDFGRISTAAKGARRPKSPFRGKLDLFYVTDLSFRRSRTSDLHSLAEVKLKETHPSLRRNLEALTVASYGGELLEMVSESETPIQALYDLMLNLLAHLSSRIPRQETLLSFELKVLEEAGLRPDFQDTFLTASARRAAQELAFAAWDTLHAVEIRKPELTQVEVFLRRFLPEHFGRPPKHRQQAIERLSVT